MRKFLFNTTVLGAAGGAWGVFQATRKGPRDWRLVLIWASWLISVALAVGSVIEDSNERRTELER